MWRQVKFQVINPDLMEEDSDNIFGGIAEYIEDDATGDTVLVRIICGCCGSEFDPEEVEIIEIYKDWMDIQDAINEPESEPAPEPEPFTIPIPYVMPETEKRAWFFCG